MSNKKVQTICSNSNPFSDSQARNYSDARVTTEFCPTSQFWTLFNDQHEVLLGARGCGKTILLKMMRYSLLRRIDDPYAKAIVDEKKYIAFYVPLHLEFIKRLSKSELTDDEKITWFRFSFNCILAQSVLFELGALVDDLNSSELEKIKSEYDLAQQINAAWGLENGNDVHQFGKLRELVAKLYYNTDPLRANSVEIPASFTHSLGSSLTSIRECICGKLRISPTWILCVDEAEFLDECYQKCINTAFRSHTDYVAIKMATLPFYYVTKKTLDNNIEVMNGQDFKYTIVSMKYDGPDFIRVADEIVKKRCRNEKIDIDSLGQFVKTLGNDMYNDYFFEEFGKDTDIKELIFSQISVSSRTHNTKKTREEIQKTVIDKLAPILYVREFYKKSRNGSYIPGWYVGANMIRRISQGNPRIFIRIMNDLFDKANGKRLPLSLKAQQTVIEKFSKSFCEETATLESVGPEAKYYLEYIATRIHEKTHNGFLTPTGLNFTITRDSDFSKHVLWLQKAVAFSRISVDEDSMLSGITEESVFELSNLYAARYWLPMRTSKAWKVSLPPLNQNMQQYVITIPNTRNRKRSNNIIGQVSFLPEEVTEDNEG